MFDRLVRVRSPYNTLVVDVVPMNPHLSVHFFRIRHEGEGVTAETGEYDWQVLGDLRSDQ